MVFGPLSDYHILPSNILTFLVLVTSFVALWVAYTGRQIAGRTPTAVVALIGGNVLAFLFQLFATYRPVIDEGGLVPGLFLAGYQWWAPLTSMFLHGGMLHIIGNMIFLWIFGNKLEQRMGRKAFVSLYLLAGFFAVLVTLVGVQFWSPDIAWLVPTPFTPNVGASGAIYGLVGFTITAFPREKVPIPIPLGIVAILHPVRPLTAAVVYVIINIFFALGSGVAWWAHLGGMLIGAIWGVRWRKRGPRVRIDSVTGWGSGQPVQYTYTYRYDR